VADIGSAGVTILDADDVDAFGASSGRRYAERKAFVRPHGSIFEASANPVIVEGYSRTVGEVRMIP
jgi:hypothetical protein